MMEIGKIKNGIMEYATTQMMPKMDSKGQFMVGVTLGLITTRLENMLMSLGDNELIKSMGIMKDGQIDYEALHTAMLAQIKRQGKLVWEVPLIGRLAFDEQDLHNLHQAVMRQGGAA